MAITLSIARIYPKVVSAGAPGVPSMPAGPGVPGVPSMPAGPVKAGTVRVVFAVVVDVDAVRVKLPLRLVGIMTVVLKLPYVLVVMFSVKL